MPNSSNDCLFCKIVAKKVPSFKIMENDQAYAFLDIYPVSKGHTLVIPKEHSLNMLDTADEALCEINKMAKKICHLYREALKVDDFLVKSHNGKLAGQEVDHFHIHIIPCYSADSKNNQRKKATDQELEALQKTITSHLD
jgi:histidine triad (HIT) family protein